MVELVHKFVAWSPLEFFATNAPDPPNWTLNSCFVVFRSFGCICNVSLLHETYCKMGWTGATKGKVCAMKSNRNFFATNAPDPPHWTLNSWFGAFHSVGAFSIVSLLHESWCKVGWNGRINAQVRAIKPHQNFSKRTHPIHPIEH